MRSQCFHCRVFISFSHWQKYLLLYQKFFWKHLFKMRKSFFFQIPEFDNLYLDMNGIIHMCSHPEDDNPHFRITEEKIFEAIFHYIEVWNNPTTYETGRNCSEQQFSSCNEWNSLRIDPILYVLGLVQNDTSQEGILHGYRWSCPKGKNESAKRS